MGCIDAHQVSVSRVGGLLFVFLFFSLGHRGPRRRRVKRRKKGPRERGGRKGPGQNCSSPNLRFHLLNRIVSVVHGLAGDGQDDQRILRVHRQDVLQQPVPVHVEPSHARLVVRKRYSLGNVPKYDEVRQLDLSTC